MTSCSISFFLDDVMHCPLVGKQAVDDEDDGMSSPLSYDNMLARNPTVQQNHLVKLLEQLFVHNRASVESLELPNSRIPSGADVPTLLGTRSFSLFDSERKKSSKVLPKWIRQSRWPHWHADQVHGLMFRELGGGYARHKQAPSVRTPSYVIVKPAVLVDRIQIIKKLRGHRNAMYCAIFDGTGRYVITGSDDRLVKLWSAETGLCLRSCRGHEVGKSETVIFFTYQRQPTCQAAQATTMQICH